MAASVLPLQVEDAARNEEEAVKEVRVRVMLRSDSFSSRSRVCRWLASTHDLIIAFSTCARPHRRRSIVCRAVYATHFANRFRGAVSSKFTRRRSSQRRARVVPTFSRCMSDAVLSFR